MEFVMALLIFPLISLLFGIVGQIVIQKVYIVVGITFLGWFIATFIIFNESFLIWVLIYSILALIGSVIVHSIQEFKKSKDT